tara:strand:+ start:14101 stop:14250 length:150 start_codon:yes stop_codon:yes gene_type:complete
MVEHMISYSYSAVMHFKVESVGLKMAHKFKNKIIIGLVKADSALTSYQY